MLAWSRKGVGEGQEVGGGEGEEGEEGEAWEEGGEEEGYFPALECSCRGR